MNGFIVRHLVMLRVKMSSNAPRGLKTEQKPVEQRRTIN